MMKRAARRLGNADSLGEYHEAMRFDLVSLNSSFKES